MLILNLPGFLSWLRRLWCIDRPRWSRRLLNGARRNSGKQGLAEPVKSVSV